MSLFYPNECYICKKRTSLKRCGRCRLVSYCGENHQKTDWNMHKEFCSVIAKIEQTKKISHIYENLRGCSARQWMSARQNMVCLASTLLHRNLEKHETEMLHFPRSCIVCYDTTQDNLTNCSHCPLVSFCKKHSDTSAHDEICPDIKISHDLELTFFKQGLSFLKAALVIQERTSKGTIRLPKSIAEFMNLLVDDTDIVKQCISLMYHIPLTIVSAIYKLHYDSLSRMTIHVIGLNDNQDFSPWEIILHLLPNLNHLTIVAQCLDPLRNGKILLCPRCTSRKKKVFLTTFTTSFPTFVSREDYTVPNFTTFVNLTPAVKEDQDYPCWKKIVEIWPRLKCPLVFMTDTDKSVRLLRDCLKSTSWKPTICFDESNSFASMFGLRDWEDWKISIPGKFLTVTQGPKSCNGKEENSRDSRVIPKEVKNKMKINVKNDKNDKRFFSAGVCNVCNCLDAPLPCKRCKMIFYCKQEHAKIDWPAHKEICKAIMGILNEKGTPHLFDNLKTTNDDQWLTAKVTFMDQIEMKLQRGLSNFEREIFLFPRTCFICRESNLSVLKVCECGVSLCKIHRDDSRHKSLCKDFSFDLKLHVNEVPAFLATVTISADKKDQTLPLSMDRFVESYIILETMPSNLSIQDYKILASDFFTRPLSFIYVIEKLKYCLSKNVVIHVIGSSSQDVSNVNYWQIVLDWLKIESLQIIFIGMELCQKEVSLNNPLNLKVSFLPQKKDFKYRTIQGSYDQYFKSGTFLKPDIIIGYNFDQDSRNLANAQDNVLKTLLTIKQINVPFIMTATSEKRARGNVEIVCKHLGKMNNFQIFQKNPYGSLIPERDFATEGLCYSNYYITVYTKFTEGASKKKIVSTADCTDCDCRSIILANAKNKITPLKKSELELNTNKIKSSEAQTKVEKSESGVKNKPNRQIKEEKSGLEAKNKESNVQISDKNSETKAEVNLSSEMLMKENLLLQEQNKILKENLQLREENERLKKENLKLNKELESLQI